MNQINGNKPAKQFEKHPYGFGPKVQPQNIPQQLKESAKWCVWEAVERTKSDGTKKIDKIPRNVNGRISTSKPKTWLSYEEAYGLYIDSVKDNGNYKYNGVGILVENVICVDIDGDLDQGEWEFIDANKEYSPSGKGLRIIGDGWTDFDITNPVEIYSGNAPRFVTITGDTIESGWSDISDVANRIVLENKTNEVNTNEARKEENGGLPEILIYDEQDWWITNNLSFPKDCKDRSSVLYGWSKTLVSEGLTNQQILSIYVGNPEILSMAKEHRAGKLEKAKKYLWSDINKARLEVKAEYDNDIGEFGEIEGLVDFDDVEEGQADGSITGDIEIDNLLVSREKQKDSYKIVERNVLQPWNKDVSVALPSLSRLKFAYRNVVYSGVRGKFYSMDKNGFIKTHTEKDYLLCEIDMSKIMGKVEGDVDSVKHFMAKAKQGFTSGVKKNRQIISFNRRVDMFITKPIFIRYNDGIIDHIVPHQSFEIKGEVDNSHPIIADYKKHFPQLDEFLDFIVNSRMAGNRRKCSLWLQAASNWGKGFLTSVFQELGIVMSITEDELEKAFSGAPIGKNMELAYRSWILHIDEFKKVKAELKLLDNSLTGASKNQLETKIEVYMKLFTSAETVNSLAGEAGVESQFANRFSYFDGLEGDIEHLDSWIKYGQSKCFAIVKNYIATKLNTKVDQMVKMGRVAATKEADRGIGVFHKKHCIIEAFSTLESNYGEIGEDFVTLVNKVVEYGISDESYGADKALEVEINKNAFKIKRHDGETKIFIKRASSIMHDFLYNLGGRSEGVKLAYKADKVLDICADEPIKKNKALTVQKIYKVNYTTRIVSKGVILQYLELGNDDFSNFEDELEDF